MGTQIEKKIRIDIPKKFTEKHIGPFMHNFYNLFKSDINYDYIFDFTNAEWIANQNLLLLSSIVKYLYNSDKKFKIKLLDFQNLNKRKVEQVCELWYIWKFISIFDKKEYDFLNYIETIGNDTLKNLCKKFEINISKYTSEEYYTLYEDQFSVIPFVSLNYIKNAVYENTMNAQLKPVYELNDNINNQLIARECSHPFISKTISAIITKELYDNFLDHFEKEKSLFKSSQDWAFMSISLKKKHHVDNQIRFKKNFKEEEIDIVKSFFFDSKQMRYKNEDIIQFSFIDFGAGIVETLKEQFKKENQIIQSNLFAQIEDNDVLQYAFKYNSSRNPILDKYEKINQYIPRGLFDLLVIVKRYNGLLFVRSNYGKILYNFSESNKISNSISFFDKQKIEYFPGTYISIYIPAWRKDNKFDKSVIQPEFQSMNVEHKPRKSQNINLFSIISELSTDPDIRYKSLIDQLSQKLKYNEDINLLTYISFFGVTDRSLIEKTIFFLIGSYGINQHNSIIIVYPPSKNIIDEINNEILELDEDSVIQDYKINPIPLIYLDIENQKINMNWIGIFNEEDKNKLNDLLSDIHSVLLTDLKDGYKAVGNTNIIDKYGNFSSRLPIAKTLLNYYQRYEHVLFEEALNEYSCQKKDGIYLCNGNYYQESFLQLTNVLNSRKYRYIFSLFLFEKIRLHIKEFNGQIKDIYNDLKYIAITASSHKILKTMLQYKNNGEVTTIQKENCIFLESYLDFENELKNKVEQGKNYILICDVIATGNITQKLDLIISENKSKLIAVAAIVNTLDVNFKNYYDFKKSFVDTNRLLFLYSMPIPKFDKKDLTLEHKERPLIRINPFTNIPITLSDEVTFNDSILLTNDEFLECVDIEDLEIGFKLFNNLIHPYFFKTAEILKKENEKIKNRDFSNSLIFRIFKKLKEKEEYEDANFIFYPKHSDIEFLQVEQLQIETKIFGKGGVKYFELERYNPGTGWKFPHTVDYLRNEIENEVVLILDDGSCSGDSLYQMANELSYYFPRTINIISIIGRVEDHKREFFSKIGTIKSKNKEGQTVRIENIDTHIFFGSYWHIPTFYLEMNPYKEELDWLEKVIEIQNTPKQIRTYAKSIKDELSPKSDEELKSKISQGQSIEYRFFPKSRNNAIETKKEILKIRNEIGKIIGYRFYMENFYWFNNFVKKSINTDFKDKKINKDFEHLLMCLVYEPYLYKRIRQIIPEIKDQICSFIESIIFKKVDLTDFLNYSWSKKDIVHLYFIAYSENELVNNMTLNRFEKLMEFVGYSNVDYLLFKILFYSPKNNEKFGNVFRELRRVLSNYSIQSNKKINLFRHFISSIPYGNTFTETVDYIQEEYQKILSTSPEHKESIKAKLDSAASNIDTYVLNFNTLSEDTISVGILYEAKEDLKHVIEVLSKILTLTDKYPAYFSKYYTWFEQNDNSLRNRYNSICNYLEDIDTIDITNIEKLLKHIREIKDRFCDSNLAPYNIFSNPYTFNISEILSKHVQEFIQAEPDYNILIQSDGQFDLAFPQYIIEKIVINNLLSNFKEYADKMHPITINISKIDSNIIIKIKNIIKNNSTKVGSYIGTQLIRDLNDCPNDIFFYENNDSHKVKDFFIQNIKFKSLNI